MPTHQYFVPDFVEIQRESFLTFLKKGILEEFAKRNPITNQNKNIEIFFYSDYFCLTKPQYSIQQAIFFKKSYVSKLYIPIQYTDKNKKVIYLKWILIAQLPLMTKRGHFVLNGAARVIINQLVRSPGVYFRENFYEIYFNKWASKPSRILQRFYADIICLKGTWVRIEIQKDFSMWVRFKKGPKIPLLWFLLGMGLNEKMIFQSVISPNFLLKSFTEKKNSIKFGKAKNSTKISSKVLKYPYVSTTPEAWKQIAQLLNLKKIRRSNIKKNSNQLSSSEANPSKGGQTHLLNSVTGHFPSPNIVINNDRSLGLIRAAFTKPSLAEVNKSPYLKVGEATSGGLAQPRGAKAKSSIRKVSPTQSLDKRQLKFQSNRFLLAQPLAKQVKGKLNKKGRILSGSAGKKEKKIKESVNLANLGRKWFFQRLMNPRTYDLGKKGRLAFNQKLGLTILPSQTTLTAQDLLFITDYLMKVEKGVYPVDDIDHLKNKRIRSAGELIQMQFGIGLMRLEKTIRFKLNTKPKKNQMYSKLRNYNGISYCTSPSAYSEAMIESSASDWVGPKLRWPNPPTVAFPQGSADKPLALAKVWAKRPLTPLGSGVPCLAGLAFGTQGTQGSEAKPPLTPRGGLATAVKLTAPLPQRPLTPRGGLANGSNDPKTFLWLNSLIQPKVVNGALKEFFGTHPLSQFMDQINPLAEITHKRRLTSLGPGGVSRDSATLAIRGIHPSHYGRICPIETPEGKNTGLVNSLTVYARVNEEGFILSPFYSLYKAQIQKSLGKIYLSAGQEENFQIATPDLNITNKNFLPKQKIPVRSGKNFFNGSAENLSFMGISPLQMISVATSLIPFLEHDDANRALMGSNMQRQAVPLIQPERPLIGTGLEAKAISDSGYALTTRKSGFVLYASGSQIILYTNETF